MKRLYFKVILGFISPILLIVITKISFLEASSEQRHCFNSQIWSQQDEIIFPVTTNKSKNFATPFIEIEYINDFKFQNIHLEIKILDSKKEILKVINADIDLFDPIDGKPLGGKSYFKKVAKKKFFYAKKTVFISDNKYEICIKHKMREKDLSGILSIKFGFNEKR